TTHPHGKSMLYDIRRPPLLPTGPFAGSMACRCDGDVSRRKTLRAGIRFDVARDLLVSGEPHAWLRCHVENQFLERGDARAVPGNMRMHRQDVKTAFIVGDVEF